MFRRVFLSLPAAAILLRAQNTPASDVPLLTPKQLKKYLEEKGDKVFILDVREPKELEEFGALKGYVNIPLRDVEKRLAEIPKDRPVLVACSLGVRAARAAATLKNNGYENVDARVAMKDWREKGEPVVYPKAGDKPDDKGKK